jgi:putative selenate reductase
MMSGEFFILTIERVLKWILEEEKSGSVFGIPAELFFKPSSDDRFRMERYGKTLETPLGVAAGPHSQLAPNIVSAWLTGARYIELKTVQTLDELNVSKPCIDMEDEGYNCEWSQELKLKQSFHQYLDAWILLHLLKHKFNQDGLPGKTGDPGFIFNISVGYNMEGILKENVQWFLDKMENCRTEKEEKLDRISKLYPAIKDIDIPDRMSDNVTLSTMHGCPPDEIEKIARYLIEERRYHTTVKLNPTLLGPERLRDILNRRMGFDTEVPDEAFGHDLKYVDAVNIIQALRSSAAKSGVDFSLKMSNTLECINKRDVFPAGEKMMYMSGRALHPLTVNLAHKLQESFNGELDISFSGGADCFNITDIIACGMKPVTVCSDLLKPGGYGRLRQYLENLDIAMTEANAANLEQWVTAINSEKTSDTRKAAQQNLKNYAQQLLSPENNRFGKGTFPGVSIKTPRPLHYFDCIQAPCRTTCPAHQAVPRYMAHTAGKNYESALRTILETNPFPTVTGMVCDHACMTKCTRQNIDNSLNIRAIKRFVSQSVQKEPPLLPAPEKNLKVAVVGAGPSGLSCAFYLALRGVDVDVYETKNIPGGMVSDAIPAFRLKEEDIWKDIRRIEGLGVGLHYNFTVDKTTFNALRKEHHVVYVAVGASRSYRLNIPGEQSPHVMDSLTFLSKVRRNETVELGNRIAVIGGGNSAMDAARTAWRIAKPGAEVVLLYRRTRSQMPACIEEIEAAEAEGINIMELTAPVEITDNNGDSRLKLTCCRMRLGETDDSGRRRPIKIDGSDFDEYFDTVIPAVGQMVTLDFLEEPLTPNETGTGTSEQNVFMGGDARHGAFNIITAVADGKSAADSILETLEIPDDQFGGLGEPKDDSKKTESLNINRHHIKSANRIFGSAPSQLPVEKRKSFDIVEGILSEEEAITEAERCLRCDEICNVCVGVCPNRANISYTVNPVRYNLQKIAVSDGKFRLEEDGIFQVQQVPQVFNVAEFCNECGNCRTFCPTSGAPYLDKPRVCLTDESFQHESNGIMISDSGDERRIEWKCNGGIETAVIDKTGCTYETSGISVRLDKPGYRVRDVEIKCTEPKTISLKTVLAMITLAANIKFIPLPDNHS